MEEEVPFCRLCLTTSVVYYSLLRNNGKEMVLSLTGIEIDEDDPYTESCAKCWLDLKLAYFIQQSFVEAEKKLRNSPIESKIEETIIKIESDSESIKETGNTRPNFEAQKECKDGEGGEELMKETENTEGDLESQTECNDEEDNDSDDDDDENHELIYIETEEDIDVTPSICTICGMEFKNDTKLYSHIHTHYNGPQQCDVCTVDLPNIPAYRDHLVDKHPNLCGTTHTCGICSLIFKYKPLYNMHLAGVHPKTALTRKLKNVVTLSNLEANDSPFKCEQCKKVFSNRKAQRQHMNSHIKRICPICGATLSVSHINNHIRCHKMNPSVCHLCGITCKHSESLKWHMYHTHANLKKRVCPECGQEFKKSYPFKLHLKKHGEIKSCMCDTCGKRFSGLQNLDMHIRTIHLKERPHACQYCEETFAKRNSLRDHERKHTMEQPYVCNVCGESFRINLALRKHKTSVHNIEEAKTAECPDCEKMFKDNRALRTHITSMHK